MVIWPRKSDCTFRRKNSVALEITNNAGVWIDDGRHFVLCHS